MADPQLVPVDHDPFASDGPQFVPVDHDPFSQAGSTVSDTAMSLGTGLVKGVAHLASLPADLRRGVQAGASAIATRMGADPQKVGAVNDLMNDIYKHTPAVMGGGPSGEDNIKTIEQLTGPLHQPQTVPGAYGETVGEFLPAAVGGTGGIVRRGLQTIIPALFSETAGQLTKGQDIEPYARALSGVSSGVLTAILTRPSTVASVLRQQLPDGVTAQHVTQAEGLMADAGQRGIALTWPEALSQVSGRPVLTDVQRILESTARTRPQMQEMMSERPGQVAGGVNQELNNIAPANAAPSSVGPQAAQAAEGVVGDVRKAINNAAEPFYRGSEAVELTPQEMARVRAVPGFREAADAVRADPQLNRDVANLPMNSVGFLNEVKKYLDQQAQNANRPFAPNPNMQRAAGYGQDARQVREVATTASGDPNRQYLSALAIEQTARERYLEPLMNGPLGQIAQADSTKKAVAALFSANPLPGSEREVGTAVRAIAGRSPEAARDLVRTYAEMTFNEAAQNLQGGANQFGGAKFAATIAGNPQQRANLEAAVRALPNGGQTWQGFSRLLEVLEATGQRQAIGSKTAFNADELKSLGSGSMAAEAVKTAASPGKWWTVVNDKWSHWQMGRNLDGLARLLTDPGSAADLRSIANMSTRTEMLIARAVGSQQIASRPPLEQRTDSEAK